MRDRICAAETPVSSASTNVTSAALNGKEALMRAGKTLRMELARGASRAMPTSLAAMRSL
ncbi:hypothetical protein AS156_35925 [Bradyrhizobium macuxiense]|uniref:Uncharacterized protein n=1 Tax=Bradyrhizobium macuxiense TaxID=1755647 RepID=A0A109JZU7_9BRAD|nr:hypothetical protein AS156_35925 [Bradyrhizobium macuxiense]